MTECKECGNTNACHIADGLYLCPSCEESTNYQLLPVTKNKYVWHDINKCFVPDYYI